MINVAVDFDSVLADTMVVWVHYYNKKYGKSLVKADVHSWEFWRDFGISREEAFTIFDYAWLDWENLPATEIDLSRTIERLSQYAKMDIVTSTKAPIENVKKWLEHQLISYCNFIHIKEETKLDLDYDIFIEDAPDVADAVSKYEKVCLLYDQPWNRKAFTKNVFRIYNLREAIGFLKDYQNR